MISDFAEDVIARAIREGVTLAPTADGLRIHYQAHVAPLSASLRALLLDHKPAILAVLSAGGVKSFSWGFAPFEVDGVTVVICQTYAEAEALTAEMIADAAGKPVALDIETHPTKSERERLAALKAERAAINAEAIAYRKAAKKAGAPQPEIDAVTEEANAKLKVLDHKIDYAKPAGLDPHRANIRLLQLYGGSARAAVIDISKAGVEALGLLQGVDAVIHNAPFDLAFLDHAGVTLGRVHDTQQAARLTIGASKCGLAAAVKFYLKATLDKEPQASDWAAPELTEDQIRDAVIHNAPFDLAFLDHAGVTLGRVHDTQQAARLTIGASKCGLAAAVKFYLKATLDKEPQASDWAAPELTEDQIRDAARDAIWLQRLCRPLFQDLGPQASAYKIQAPAALPIARMNNAGIMLDLDAHAGAMQAFAEADAVASAAYREACVEIGQTELAAKVPKTAAEIVAFLNVVLTEAELANWPRTKKTGALSTGKAALSLAAQYPPVPPLIELSTLNGLRLSFGEPLRFRVNPVTGRVHPHYQLAGAQTRRSTSSEPNIQGTPRDLRIRALFRAADGYVFYAADFHCMELRATGLFFEDPALNGVFERGDDPHTLTASHVTGKPPEEITDAERSSAKNTNFGTIYGIGPASLVWQIWKNYRRRVSLDEAENLLVVFERLYPTTIAHRREYAHACQVKRHIIIGPEWREGRGRIVPLARLPEDQSPTTCAYSYPIQGICADVCMKAITDVDRRLREQAIDGRLIAWIHDELIVEAREADAAPRRLLCLSHGSSRRRSSSPRRGPSGSLGDDSAAWPPSLRPRSGREAGERRREPRRSAPSAQRLCRNALAGHRRHRRRGGRERLDAG